jgi:hypothetical protein
VVVDVILFSLQLRHDRQLRSTLGNPQLRPHPVRESVGNKFTRLHGHNVDEEHLRNLPDPAVRRGKRALHSGGWTFVYS